MSKKVSFEIDKEVVERPTHWAELEIQHTVKLNQADNTPADSELVGDSLVELKDKAIKDKVELTRVEKGKLDKMRVRNTVDPTDRSESATTLHPKDGKNAVTSRKSY